MLLEQQNDNKLPTSFILLHSLFCNYRRRVVVAGGCSWALVGVCVTNGECLRRGPECLVTLRGLLAQLLGCLWFMNDRITH